MITSVQNTTIKNLARLKNKKDRDRSGLFLVEGLHMIQEAAAAGLLQSIYAIEGWQSPLPAEPEFCTQNVLNKLSSQKSDASLIGVCRRPVFSSALGEQQAKKFLLLDHIQDPGNVGSLIRSAYAFGVQAVILSADCADPYAPKTLQSTQGALFHLPVLTADLADVIRQLQNADISVFAAALHQNSVCLHDLSVPASFGVIIGNEGQGIRQELIHLADQTV